MKRKSSIKKDKNSIGVLPLEIIFLYFIFLLILCVASIFFVLHISQVADKTYGNLVSKQIYDYKKEYLQYTVENAIVTFDEIKANVENQLNEEQAFFLEKFAELLGKSQRNSNLVVSSIQSILIPQHLFLKIIDERTNQTIVSNYPNSIVAGEIYYKKTAIIEEYFIEISYSHSYLYEKMLDLVATFIHEQTFSNDSYIWINEVHNWEGGDNYAIRLVHPNLIETEGDFLSTSMQDISGNYPYLEELEGIKESGTFFNTYYFKRKNTEEIALKLTYASLYKEFNWIVAMGVHIDDVDYHIQYISKESKRFTNAQILKTILILGILFLTVLFFLVVASTYYIHRVKRRIAKESNLDFLTNIYNRKIADEHLLVAFYEYKKTAHNQFVFLIDIDDFKNINDRYGHTAGDKVLKRIVEILQREMREEDSLFRWGGEEFVLVSKFIEIEDIASFAQRIIDSVRNTPIIITQQRKKSRQLDREVLEGERLKYQEDQKRENSAESKTENKANGFLSETTRTLSLTISAGVSCFSPNDMTYLECFKRIDLALYESKTSGKNKYTILY